MSDGIEKIIAPIVILGIIAAIFLYLANNLPEDFSQPFRDIGNIAFGGTVFLIILIVIVVSIMIYSKTK